MVRCMHIRLQRCRLHAHLRPRPPPPRNALLREGLVLNVESEPDHVRGEHCLGGDVQDHVQVVGGHRADDVDLVEEEEEREERPNGGGCGGGDSGEGGDAGGLTSARLRSHQIPKKMIRPMVMSRTARRGTMRYASRTRRSMLCAVVRVRRGGEGQRASGSPRCFRDARGRRRRRGHSL